MSRTDVKDTSMITGTRHPSLYFEDGDVVLSARSVDDTFMFFRVDKVYLARQSPVFQGMFALPLVPAVNEMYDGVPCVQMPDDASELEALLGAIYNISSLSLKRRNPDTPVLLSGVMKLATKYQVDSIRSLIIQHLEADWPQTVEEWGDFQTDMTKAVEQHLNTPPYYKYGGRFIDERFPEAGSALRFALDYDCPSLLRSVICVLMTTPRSADWDSIKHAEADMEYEPSAAQRAVHFPSIRWPLLDSRDWSCLARGREALFSRCMMMNYTQYPLACGPQTCRQCSDNLKLWKEKVTARLSPRDYQWPDPVYILKRLLDSGRPDAVCGVCWERAELSVRTMRQQLWDELPYIFGWMEKDGESD